MLFDISFKFVKNTLNTEKNVRYLLDM